MCASVFAGTVSSSSLIALSWMMTMSGRAVVGTMDRGTADGGLSNALWPGRSVYNVGGTSRCPQCGPKQSCDVMCSDPASVGQQFRMWLTVHGREQHRGQEWLDCSLHWQRFTGVGRQ